MRPKAPTRHNLRSAICYCLLLLEAELSKVEIRSVEHREIWQIIRILTELRDQETEKKA